jgi:hypothetical protein
MYAEKAFRLMGIIMMTTIQNHFPYRSFESFSIKIGDL